MECRRPMKASNESVCPIDGCGRQVAFQVTVSGENGVDVDIPVCPNHKGI